MPDRLDLIRANLLAQPFEAVSDEDVRLLLDVAEAARAFCNLWGDYTGTGNTFGSRFGSLRAALAALDGETDKP